MFNLFAHILKISSFYLVGSLSYDVILEAMFGTNRVKLGPAVFRSKLSCSLTCF